MGGGSVSRWAADDARHRDDVRLSLVRALHDVKPRGQARTVAEILFDLAKNPHRARETKRRSLRRLLAAWNLAGLSWLEDSLAETFGLWRRAKYIRSLPTDRQAKPAPDGAMPDTSVVAHEQANENYEGKRLALLFAQDFSLAEIYENTLAMQPGVTLLTPEQAAELVAIGVDFTRVEEKRRALRRQPQRPARRDLRAYPKHPEVFDQLVAHQVAGESLPTIARRYGCSTSTVSRNVHRWADVLGITLTGQRPGRPCTKTATITHEGTRRSAPSRAE